MSRTFILAVCAIALLVSVQQASAGMLSAQQYHHRVSLNSLYMAACLLSRSAARGIGIGFCKAKAVSPYAKTFSESVKSAHRVVYPS